jgi:carboxyl-terminal processing protease
MILPSVRQATDWAVEKLPPPSSRGIISLVLITILLSGSVWWLIRDPKFAGQLVLETAFHDVVTYGALDADPESVFHAAASGLFSKLDPFSAYMLPEDYNVFEEETGGEYVGIGVEIKLTASAIVIVHVFAQSPAADAMLVPGDRIVAVDGVSTAGFTMRQSLDAMRGPAETTVRLTVQSVSGRERELELERRAVTVSPFPIHGIARSGCGYIRWTDFTDGSADRLAAIVEAIRVEDPSGIVIDLRGNPGGILDEAVDAAGIFLPSGSLVCRLIGRDPRENVDYRTSQPPAQYDGPIVIVQDDQSASSSEVFAAALQESGRAAVVGRKSFGKGWVQNIYDLDDGSALRLSTARYYTPQGRTFGNPSAFAVEDTLSGDSSVVKPAGLDPDVVVPATPVGPWRETLAERGLVADFVLAHQDEWTDENEVLDELHDWCDSLGVLPVTPGGEAEAEDWRVNPQRSPHWKAWEKIFKALDTAQVNDAELLFNREAENLYLMLLEERLSTSPEPDEEELETYMSLDPDLAEALDLIEDTDHYHDVVARWQTQMSDHVTQ